MTNDQGSYDGQEFLAPDNDGGWHYTTMRDWIAVCPEISATAIRLYWIVRSIMHEKGDKSRRLSIDQLCWLLPGVNGKPTSITRVKDALRELEQAGLLSNPDGAVTRQWVMDPATGQQTRENFRRWQIHDLAPEGYGHWRSAIAKLAAYPGIGWQNTEGRKSASQAGPRLSTALRPGETPETAGQTESRISAQPGRISDQTGRISGDYNAPTCENPTSNKSLQPSSLTNQPAVSTRSATSGSRPEPGWLDGPPQPQPEPQPEPQAPAAPTPGVWFLRSLPAACQPDEHAVRRLAPRVEQLLAGEWTEATLRDRLTRTLDGAHNPPGIVVSRLENLVLPKGIPEPGRPAWCGECDQRTRQRENQQGFPYRCPRCHPRCVGATASAS